MKLQFRSNDLEGRQWQQPTANRLRPRRGGGRGPASGVTGPARPVRGRAAATALINPTAHGATRARRCGRAVIGPGSRRAAGAVVVPA